MPEPLALARTRTGNRKKASVIGCVSARSWADRIATGWRSEFASLDGSLATGPRITLLAANFCGIASGSRASRIPAKMNCFLMPHRYATNDLPTNGQMPGMNLSHRLRLFQQRISASTREARHARLMDKPPAYEEFLKRAHARALFETCLMAGESAGAA
jgi:hypothetical protein